jgi:RNA polymerase sigma factor (sigma-70 family)
MDRDLRTKIDRSLTEELQALLGKSPPGVAVQIQAVLDEIKRQEAEDAQAWEVERRRKEEHDREVMKYYGRIPPKQFEAFYAKEVYGKSYEEIAEETGSKPGTVRVHYHEAKKSIARIDLADSLKQGQRKTK